MMTLVTRCEKETFKLGRMIGASCRGSEIICLWGELGSGKTVLVKGIAAGLGVDPRQVVSPTFVLLQEYRGKKIPLYHFDLFRLRSEKEIAALGYEEYFFSGGVAAVEWADRLGALLPAEFLGVELLSAGKMQRRIRLRAAGERYRALLGEVRENTGD
jgi:tRNA threonylcarbamoyladenosine biosynthesis protein TsaE